MKKYNKFLNEKKEIEYKIKIVYETGNSFGHEEQTDYLDLTWKNLDIAKENLKFIKEHYEMYCDINSYHSKFTIEQWFEKNKDKEWFVYVPKLFCISSNNAIGGNTKADEVAKKKAGEGNWEYRADEDYAEQCLYLKTDTGKKMQISAYWCGYFETLYSAKIVATDDDLEINFR